MKKNMHMAFLLHALVPLYCCINLAYTNNKGGNCYARQAIKHLLLSVNNSINGIYICVLMSGSKYVIIVINDLLVIQCPFNTIRNFLFEGHVANIK